MSSYLWLSNVEEVHRNQTELNRTELNWAELKQKAEKLLSLRDVNININIMFIVRPWNSLHLSIIIIPSRRSFFLSFFHNGDTTRRFLALFNLLLKKIIQFEVLSFSELQASFTALPRSALLHCTKTQKTSISINNDRGAVVVVVVKYCFYCFYCFLCLLHSSYLSIWFICLFWIENYHTVDLL